MLGNVWECTQDVYNEKMFVENMNDMTHAAGPGGTFDAAPVTAAVPPRSST